MGRTCKLLSAVAIVLQACTTAPQRVAAPARPDGEALALVAQARLRLADGQVTEGLRLMRRATEQEPEDLELREEYGLALAESGLADQALTELSRVGELTPSGEGTLGMLLARASSNPEMLEKALPHLEAGLAAMPQGPQVRMVLVQSLLTLGRGEKGWEVLQPLLADRPEDPRLQLMAGQALRMAGRHDESITFLEKAREREESRSRATLELVETLSAAGRFREAADLLGGFIEKEGATLAALTRWASLLARAGDRGKAREVLDDVLSRDGAFRDALMLKALLDVADGRLDSAEQLYRRALAAEPKDPDAALGLARLLLDDRRLDEARTVLLDLWRQVSEAKLEGDEAGREVAQELAAVELVARRAEQARPWLDRLLAAPLPRRSLALWAEYFRLAKATAQGLQWLETVALVPGEDNDRLRRSTRAEFLLVENRGEEARPILEELVGGAEEDVLAGLGVYQRRQLYAEAVAAARRAIARLPESTAVRFAFAAGLERTAAFEEAVAEFRTLVAKEPDSAAALNYLGYMFAERGINLAEARTMLTRAVELDPTSGAYQDSLGWVYFRLGDLDRAEKHLTEAVRLEPDDATVLEHLGDLHQARGEGKKASDAFRRSLAAGPEEAGQRERVEKKLAAVEGNEAAR